MSTYQQIVRDLSHRQVAGLTGQTENPWTRGFELSAKVVIFGSTATMPIMLGLLAAIGLVLFFISRAL